MTHTPTATDALYTCPACSFRCVVTPRGIIVTEHSADDAAHLAAIEQAAAQRRAWAERVVGRLGHHYDQRRAIFWELYRQARDEGQQRSASSFGSERDDGVLSLQQLQRLTRWVIAEYV